MIEAIVQAPVGLFKQWMKPKEDGSTEAGSKFDWPPAEVMPGTRKFNGREVAHLLFDGTEAELGNALHKNMDIVAVQSAGGDSIRPVPASFVDWIERAPDDADPQPGHPLHHYAGHPPWVWG